jgi:malonyl-CoA O-methyltransferase
VAADAHALPFSNGSFDLVWTNLSMHWWVDPVKVLAECRRVLRPEGLLIMSGFGPDTLTELRHLNAQFDEREFVPTFQDLHDVGDALNQHQFADPVMDMERLTIQYQQPDRLLADLRAMGGNSLTARDAGLKGVGWLRALNRHLASEFAAVQKHGNAFSLSFEIVYGHAWVPKPKSLPDGYSPIEFRPRQSRMPR